MDASRIYGKNAVQFKKESENLLRFSGRVQLIYTNYNNLPREINNHQLNEFCKIIDSTDYKLVRILLFLLIFNLY